MSYLAMTPPCSLRERQLDVTPENRQRGFDMCKLGWVMWVENAPGFFLIELHALRKLGIAVARLAHG